MTATTKAALDAIVVGAGHNGLVAASYLARQGRRVLLIEQADGVGGAAGAVLRIGGANVAAGATWSGMLLPEIVADLRLGSYGYESVPLDPQLLTYDRRGHTAAIFLEPAHTAAFFKNAGYDDGLARRLLQYESSIERAADLLRRLFDETDPTARKDSIGKADTRILDTFARSIDEELRRWHFPPVLEAGLAAGAISLTNSSPYAASTAFALAYMAAAETNGLIGAWGRPVGGMQALMVALSRAARDLGVELLLNTKVGRILVKDGEVLGVELHDGRQVLAPQVIASVHPLDFASLIGGEELLRAPASSDRGLSASVRLALTRLPAPTETIQQNMPHGTNVWDGLMVSSPGNLTDITSALSDVQRGLAISSEPIVTFSSGIYPGAEHNIVEAYVQFVDYDTSGERIIAATMDAISAGFPGIADCVVDAVAYSPGRLERDLRLRNGHPEHGTMTYPGLVSGRPDTATANYASPIVGLYAGAAGWFPGGTVIGVPGRNAARLAMMGGTSEGAQSG